MRFSLLRKRGGFWSSLFFVFFLLVPPLLHAEIVEEYEDEDARELNRALEDFRSQQSALTKQIEAHAKSGTLNPAQMLQLVDQIKQDPSKAKELASELLNNQKAVNGGASLNSELAQKQFRAFFSLYNRFSIEELTQQFAENMNSGRYGRPLLKLFPWSPRFLASWVKNGEAPGKAVELVTKRDYLLIFAVLNVMIVIMNWVWKRMISRRELGLMGHFKRLAAIWGLRAALFYFMLWPYLGKTIEMLIFHARFSKPVEVSVLIDLKALEYSQSACLAV